MKNRNPLARLFLQIVVLSIFLLLCVAGVWAVVLWSKTPGYWQKQQATRMNQPTAQSKQQAGAVNESFARVLPSPAVMTASSASAGSPSTGSNASAPPPSISSTASNSSAKAAGAERVTHQLHLNIQDLNAWIDHELPALLESQQVKMPPEIKLPMLAVEGGNLVLAFRYESSQTTQVVSLIIKPVMQGPADRPQLRLEIQGLRGGRLPLPSQSVIESFQEMAQNKQQPGMKLLGDILGGKAFDPVFPIFTADKPTGVVRLLNFKLASDGLDLTLRVDPNR